MISAPIAPPPRPPAFRATERRTPERPCLNCGDPMPGNYCRNCGQRKVEVHVSIARMLMEALDDQFSLNSALPRTIGALMFRPGHLTREYMSGRIARYIPPFRLYLVASVVFFLALSLLPALRNPDIDLAAAARNLREGDSTAVHAGSGARLPRAPAPPALRPGAGANRLRNGVAAPPPVPLPPRMSWLEGVRVNTEIPELDSIVNARIEHFRRMEPREAARQVVSDYLGHVPQMMFVLLPVFAALLKLLYIGSRRFYVEHFVFALHVHAFAFLAYLTMIAVRWPPLMLLLGGWLVLYLYLALKKVYRQGWFVTGVKYLALGGVYFCVVSFAAVLTFIATLLMA